MPTKGPLWFNALLQPIWDNSQNRVIQIYGALHNITKRMQAEKALIENQRLSAIGEIASFVAHDFNNSLQSIMGNLQLALLNTNIPDEVLVFLKTIQTAT